MTLIKSLQAASCKLQAASCFGRRFFTSCSALSTIILDRSQEPSLSCVSDGVPTRNLNKFLRSFVLSSLTCSLSSTIDWSPYYKIERVSMSPCNEITKTMPINQDELTSLESWRWKIFSSTVPVARKRYVKHLFFWPSRQHRAAAVLWQSEGKNLKCWYVLSFLYPAVLKSIFSIFNI